jgi:RNA polymerase sigma-70 factor, ECF subfamily
MNKPDRAAELVAALFERHQAEIFAYLYRLVNNRDLAHDLTQETFLRLLAQGDRLAEVENQRAWIYRVAGNLAFNALKRRRLFAWLPWPMADALGLSRPDPADALGEETAVSQTLAALPPHYRAVLLLYAHYEMSVREIAIALDISESNVKVRLHRAREKFRQIYEE